MVEWPPSQAPMNTNTMTPGTRKCPGTKASLATCRLHIISSPAATTLAITSIHTIEKVMWRSVVSMSGPGRMSCRMRALSRIAVPRLPGIANATAGISAPPLVALLAASGAMTPRMSPRPKRLLSRADCTAWP